MKPKCLFIWIFLCIASFFCGCSSESEPQNIEYEEFLDSVQIDTIVVDTVMVSSNDYILEYYPDSPPFLKGVVEIPSREQNPVLADSFAVWVISEYGELDDAEKQAGIPIITKELLMKMADSETQYSFAIRKVYENPYIVSFVSETDWYSYGTHGIQSRHGATFIKSSGRHLGWDMFKGKARFQPVLKKGLETYYDTEDLRRFGRFVDSQVDIDQIPLPSVTPWVEKDGIRFIYGNYEIGSYADGLPSFVVPIEEAEEILIPEVYDFLRKTSML